MSKKEKEFEVVPQVEIDGTKFHESAEVSFGITREVFSEVVDGNEMVTKTYRLKKYVMVRNKVASETVLRKEEGSAGKLTLLHQMSIEIQKEMKRMEK